MLYRKSQPSAVGHYTNHIWICSQMNEKGLKCRSPEQKLEFIYNAAYLEWENMQIR